MVNGKKVIAVMPAYNAKKTLAQTVDDVPRDVVDDIILVDDASTDGTADVSRSLGLTTIVHDQNRGYGGNQKMCYAAALARGAEVVVMVHPDHQYDPHYIKDLVEIVALGQADAAFGSRMLIPGGALKGGMPRWKYLANIMLTALANGVLRLRLSEYHSGFRAYSRRALETVRFEKNSDNFVFDTEIIVQLKDAGFQIRELAIPTRYFKDASSIGWWKSVEYGLSIAQVLGRYRLYRLNIWNDSRYIAGHHGHENSPH